MMGCLNPFMFLTVLWLVHGTNGLTVSVTGPSVVQQGNNTEFTCTVNGGTATRFGWMDGSVKPPATIYSGGGRFSTNSKYSNFLLTPKTAITSVMTIKNTTVEDEGLYYCSIPQDDSGIISLSVQGTNVVTVSVTGPSVVQQGNNAVFTCTVNGGTVARLRWMDDSVASSLTIYSGGARYSTNSKYSNFVLRPQETNTTSVMIIENATVEDEGLYYCSIPEDNSNIANLSVEVRSRRSLTLSSRVTNDDDTYIATCEATGGKPMESITWILNGETQSDGNGNITESTGPPATPPLSNTRSVFTFPATLDNYGQTLVCDIGGHTLTELNGQESTDLNIHTFPSAAGTTVSVAFETQGSDITVSCNASNEPMPSMRNYYIFSTNTLIHASTDGVDQFTVENPEPGTNFTCMAGNYLGNTTLSDIVTYYDPDRGQPLEPGAVAGIALGTIMFIIMIITVVLTIYFMCMKGRKRSDAEERRAVDKHSSHSSEKEKLRPVPAPRDQGSSQSTPDNPGQAEYAMVDRKKPGGKDMPDTRGADQKESPGMYADLDLSANAGKTERQVPQNPDDVVVYSKIIG